MCTGDAMIHNNQCLMQGFCSTWYVKVLQVDYVKYIQQYQWCIIHEMNLIKSQSQRKYATECDAVLQQFQQGVLPVLYGQMLLEKSSTRYYEKAKYMNIIRARLELLNTIYGELPDQFREQIRLYLINIANLIVPGSGQYF